MERKSEVTLTLSRLRISEKAETSSCSFSPSAAIYSASPGPSGTGRARLSSFPFMVTGSFSNGIRNPGTI